MMQQGTTRRSFIDCNGCPNRRLPQQWAGVEWARRNLLPGGVVVWEDGGEGAAADGLPHFLLYGRQPSRREGRFYIDRDRVQIGRFLESRTAWAWRECNLVAPSPDVGDKVVWEGADEYDSRQAPSS